MADLNFKHESMQDLDSILKYLNAVTEGLAQGKIRLAAKNKELILEPHGMLRFDVEAKRKGDQRKLAIKLSWKEEDGPESGDDTLVVESS